MDKIARLESIEILEVLEPTLNAFLDALKPRMSSITDVLKKSFKYGSTDRHGLDIYYPPTASPGKTPLLFYVYGGGFVTGDKVLEAPYDYAYPCVGAFFARQGFITVCADYRLAPHTTYPGPVEDLRDAILWVLANSTELVTPTTPNPDTDTIFIAGHSAGAVHTLSLILEPRVLPLNSELRPKIKGLILIAGYYHYDIPTGLEEPIKMYWVTEENIKSKCPLGLLKVAKENGITTLPKILFVEGEHEPKPVYILRADFQKELGGFLQSPAKVIVAKGHNHISVYAALSSGQGEEWALEASEWIRSNI